MEDLNIEEVIEEQDERVFELISQNEELNEEIKRKDEQISDLQKLIRDVKNILS